jgi:hypothetical protein
MEGAKGGRRGVGQNWRQRLNLLPGPPTNRSLDGTGSNGCKVDPERQRGLVTAMCPKTMIAGRDTEAGVEVIDDRPHSGFELKRHPVGRNSDFLVSHSVACRRHNWRNQEG